MVRELNQDSTGDAHELNHMNKEEAKTILNQELEVLRAKGYEELSTFIGSPLNYEIKGPRGTDYWVEVQAFWDTPGDDNGNLRVIASIDDGRFPSSFIPISADFIKSNDGKFIGE